MNTASKNLEDDHVHILRLTDVMEAMTLREEHDAEHVEAVIDIIRNFADGIHHAKEEELFFPALAGKGFSVSQGPVAVMISEHVIGRNFVKQISDNLVLYKAGDQAALEEINEGMKGYAYLLRSHITKENNILFRMADRALSENDNAELLASFEKSEAKRKPASLYITRIKELAEFYGI
jgi:hemerythrin-like domain-containing protein